MFQKTEENTVKERNDTRVVIVKDVYHRVIHAALVEDGAYTDDKCTDEGSW